MDRLSTNLGKDEGKLIGKHFINIGEKYPAADQATLDGFASNLDTDRRTRAIEALKRANRMSLNNLSIENEDICFISNIITEIINNDKDIVRNYFKLINKITINFKKYNKNELFNIIRSVISEKNCSDKLNCLISILKTENIKKATHISFKFDDYNKLNEIRDFYLKFLLFMDANDSIEENFHNMIEFYDGLKFDNTKLIIVLSIINDISLNHKRAENFWEKIEKFLIFIVGKNEETFDKIEIFNVFKNNKKLLYFLFEKEILNKNDFNDWITAQKKSFSKFFCPNKIELENKFEEKVKIGENDNELCKIVREDDIEAFTDYINSNKISYNFRIPCSIFETNEMLIDNKITLIEYAAFFGSLTIFNYLQQNVKLGNSIWKYAIHENNSELIKKIEDLNTLSLDVENCLEIAIKCHHSEIFEYINNTYKDKSYNDTILNNHIKAFFLIYHNFWMIPEDISINIYLFFIIVCECNYFSLMEHIIKSQNIDLRNITIMFNIALNFTNKKAIKCIFAFINEEILDLSIKEELEESGEELEAAEEEELEELEKIEVVKEELERLENIEAIKEELEEIETKTETEKSEERDIKTSAKEKELKASEELYHEISKKYADLIDENILLKQRINNIKQKINDLKQKDKNIVLKKREKLDTVYITYDDVYFEYNNKWYYKKIYEDF